MSEQSIKAPEVYRAINAVQKALSKEGITKDRTNTQGAGFRYRGIDDVYNALSGLLAENGLCILPRGLGRELVERESNAGKPLFYVVVSMEYDFVSAIDGSMHTVGPFYGEAMDSGDKATNKAMSIAYKMMAFEAFAIPTEGDNDPDANTHDVKPRPQAQAQVAPVPAPTAKVVAAPDGWVPRLYSPNPLKDEADADAFVTFMKSEIAALESKDRLEALWKTHGLHMGNLKTRYKGQHKEVSEAFVARSETINTPTEEAPK